MLSKITPDKVPEFTHGCPIGIRYGEINRVYVNKIRAQLAR